MAKVPRPRWNELIPQIDDNNDNQSVGEANVTAPFTTIQNRAKIEANCKVVGPVERIRCNSLKLLDDEFGPNGEQVRTNDKEDSRVRFVGNNWESNFSTSGLRPLKVNNGETGSYIEITYYGTGLNIMINAGGAGINIDEQTDGGAVNTVLSSFTGSSVITGRNYNVNSVIPVNKGLTKGWHTTKIILDAATYTFYGFEILNESSDLSVLSGSIFKRGKEYILENDTTVSMTPTSYSGTNGARVLTYIDEDRNIQQAVNEVGTPAYLGSTDHSNEAIYRKINFREFGRNRSDDFSTLANVTSDRAFTLDDGTTTLVGDNVYQASSAGTGFYCASTGNTFTLTFVGTGLDIILNSNLQEADTYSVEIDGVVYEPGAILNPLIGDYRYKVASNLPYGTHTVKVTRVTGGNTTTFDDFIIYHPKKPTISKDLPILADYNIMADFSYGADTTNETPSSGVLRKNCTREFIYKGSGFTPTFTGQGFFIGTSGDASAYFEYTFFGTGFDWYGTSASQISTSVLSVDGEVDLSGFNINSDGATLTYNSTTGEISTAASGGQWKLSISGLPLGVHTVRMQRTNTSTFYLYDLDVHAPIHSPNTSIGNLSIDDTRIYDNESESFAIFDMITNTVQNSKNVSQILDRGTGVIAVYFEDAYMNNLYESSLISTAELNLFSGRANNFVTNSSIQLVTRNDVGTNVDSSDNRLSVSGQKQKDKF